MSRCEWEPEEISPTEPPKDTALMAEFPVVRLNGVIWEWRTTGNLDFDPIYGPCPAERWIASTTRNMTAPPHVARQCDLIWEEYEEFREADRRMGDPNP